MCGQNAEIGQLKILPTYSLSAAFVPKYIAQPPSVNHKLPGQREIY